MPAEIAIVGEGPGANEDRYGEPFIGEAGKRLRQILSVVFEDENGNGGAEQIEDRVYLTNSVICRATDNAGKNRKPLQTELTKCKPRLWRELIAVNPKVIIAAGRSAMTCLGISGSVEGSMGDVLVVTPPKSLKLPDINFAVVPVFHPSYLIRAEKSSVSEGGPTQRVVEILCRVNDYLLKQAEIQTEVQARHEQRKQR